MGLKVWGGGVIKTGRRKHNLPHTRGPDGDKSGLDFQVDHNSGMGCPQTGKVGVGTAKA
jgi:hypothetical protein